MEFDGVIEDPHTYKDAVETRANELIKEARVISKRELSHEETQNKGISAPVGKGVRVVAVDGQQEQGCGGTHLDNTEEIGKITIKKISSKKGKTKVSYEVH